MECAKIGVPQFDGEKYALWRRRMKTYIQTQGFYVWQSVVDGYKAPSTPPMDGDGNKLEVNDSKSINDINNGVT
jgi:hypothetical protein